ncbi:hypothetical protein MUK42_28199 [Musa troglodytarum]|nr:hypothetical protein MUK42_28199 [Musa troglodytarum]
MPLRHDPVEQLPTLAQLHHEVHGVRVLVRGAEPHDVGVVRQSGHDGHLPPHVLDVDGGPQLALRDGLAGQRLPRLLVGAEVGDAELAAAELAAEHVLVADAAAVAAKRHDVLEDMEGGGANGVFSEGVRPGPVWLVLPRLRLLLLLGTGRGLLLLPVQVLGVAEEARAGVAHAGVSAMPTLATGLRAFFFYRGDLGEARSYAPAFVSPNRVNKKVSEEEEEGEGHCDRLRCSHRLANLEISSLPKY